MGIAPPDQWVLDAGNLLDHAHIQDNDAHGNRHWGIGDGYRLAGVFQGAVDNGHVSPPSAGIALPGEHHAFSAVDG